MAYSDFDVAAVHIETIRRDARRSAYVQRVQVMLIAASIATLGVVAVAGALLASLI